MTALQQVSDRFPDVETSSLITLVRVRAGVMEFATAAWERREWLADRQSQDVLGAVWKGPYRSDVFAI